MNGKPAPATLAPIAYEEPPRIVPRYLDEAEFNGLELAWVERLAAARFAFHFGGGYRIEVYAPHGLAFVWPEEM